MTMTIYKYPLIELGYSKVQLPLGAQVLSAGFQGEDLYCWALVGTDLPHEDREVFIGETGTGAEPPDASDWKFVDRADREPQDGPFTMRYVAHVWVRDAPAQGES